MFLCCIIPAFCPPQLVALTTLSTPAGAQLGAYLLEEADGAGRRHDEGQSGRGDSCSRNRLACAEMGLTGCHQSWFAWHANLSSVRSDKGVGWESVTPQRAGLRDLRNLRWGLRLARCGSASKDHTQQISRCTSGVRVAPLKFGPRDGEPTCETSSGAREICTAIGTAPAIHRTLKSACDHTAIQSSVPLAS